MFCMGPCTLDLHTVHEAVMDILQMAIANEDPEFVYLVLQNPNLPRQIGSTYDPLWPRFELDTWSHPEAGLRVGKQ